ncbi:hypothetical protein N566_09260, partial [Streptomycetaceae bacterium MP113-05]
VLSDWLLAVEADTADWPAERLELLDGVTQLIAVERERRDAARAVRRRLAQEVLELVLSGAASAELAARLRLAAPVPPPGPGSAPHWQVVTAAVDWAGEGGADIESGPVAQALLEELLDGAGTPPDTEGADRVAVAHTGDEAVALVPLPGGPVGTDAPGELEAEALCAAGRTPIERGLAGDGRLTLGVSAAVQSADGLRGALEEARHARRVAAARP